MPIEDLFIFIIALVGMAMVGGLLRTVLKHRHEARMGQTDLGASRQVELLSHENAGLKGQVGRLEERIAVLERIATDPANRTLREIEELR